MLKAEAIELVINLGRPAAEIAWELGIKEGALGNWMKHGEETRRGHGQAAFG